MRLTAPMILTTFAILLEAVLSMDGVIPTETASTADEDLIWRALDVPTPPNPEEEPWHREDCKSHRVRWNAAHQFCYGCQTLIADPQSGYLACHTCRMIKPGSTRQINICTKASCLTSPLPTSSA
ncbi:hypothetical protein PGT21_034793 [Puccinia graminis f. sp. tritici]|uniref:Phorbol-ester/DAG-type domain-containing protein n=2 Tax=Puccinia graminis f. sp. tritici TaxID=56615 RepID=E3JQ95_PUCGT|nr:uncharacterized protein PGTG_00229 [Puccinia graminis f. sp. tritici CRL 75-36-700-3]EFP74273.2 hypothetical protein PGTG_00229 [Puccinia graminis f. sp. tritici CRL 75-36-700-3]KAA1115290.1 hypothetical protein PGT21_034793 [Puccinia graminis f. sp. tritici]